MDVRELMNQLPTDAERRVHDARRRFNQLVRESIRFTTRLSLQRNQMDRDDTREERGDGPYRLAAVRVDVLPWNEAIWTFHIPPHLVQSAMLSLIRPHLDRALEASHVIAEFDRLKGTCSLAVEGSRTVFEAAEDTTRGLLEIASQFDLAREILWLDRDVLGRYKPDVHRYGDRIEVSDYGHVVLYWVPIALVAQTLGLEVEDVTVVVLTHELAHAYTHLGRDIDGANWRNSSWCGSTIEVREGLAQFYTQINHERLVPRIPKALAAYEALLTKQPSPYHAHLPWLAPGVDKEAVRKTLIDLRKGGPFGMNAFNEVLEKNRSR